MRRRMMPQHLTNESRAAHAGEPRRLSPHGGRVLLAAFSRPPEARAED